MRRFVVRTVGCHANFRSPRDRLIPHPSETFDPDEPGPHYCDDYASDGDDDKARIDYVFVADPVASHSFYLDVSRVRRRPFPRPGRDTDVFYENHEDEEGPNFLSDHLGLELTVVASRP